MAVLSLLFLLACEKNEGDESARLTPIDYALDFCSNHFGVEEWGLVDGIDLDVSCVDGSALYIKNY